MLKDLSISKFFLFIIMAISTCLPSTGIFAQASNKMSCAGSVTKLFYLAEKLIELEKSSKRELLYSDYNKIFNAQTIEAFDNYPGLAKIKMGELSDIGLTIKGSNTIIVKGNKRKHDIRITIPSNAKNDIYINNVKWTRPDGDQEEQIISFIDFLDNELNIRDVPKYRSGPSFMSKSLIGLIGGLGATAAYCNNSVSGPMSLGGDRGVMMQWCMLTSFFTVPVAVILTVLIL